MMMKIIEAFCLSQMLHASPHVTILIYVVCDVLFKSLLMLYTAVISTKFGSMGGVIMCMCVCVCVHACACVRVRTCILVRKYPSIYGFTVFTRVFSLPAFSVG